ncbi:MAG: hypothetical protein LV480_13020 [Methylacidiphilales bacterium]|nr:hypothetical protein [Candidatus Methylacidiphilales bacterium]
MPARAIAFDNEAGDFSAGLSRQIEGQRARRDNGNKMGSFQSRRRSLPKFPRIKRNRMRVSLHRSGHINFQSDRFAGSQHIQNGGYVVRYARSDQHVINLGKHRPVEGGKGGKLYLFQQVYSDDSRMIFPGQKHLDEVRHHQQISVILGHIQPAHGCRSVTRDFGLPAGRVVTGYQGRDDVLLRKVSQRPEHVTAPIALLQSPGQNDIQSRS